MIPCRPSRLSSSIATRATAAVALAALLLGAPAAPARAELSDKPTAAEEPFVKEITADLQTRYPHPADAIKADYIRYTDEDATGAISYANRQWSSIDEYHPSQLWYDAHGRLIGADFSLLDAPGSPRPHFEGVDPARWITFGDHDHIGVRRPDGTIAYRGVGTKRITAVGGRSIDPQPIDLVKAGLAPDVKSVVFAFDFPAIWDLPVWLVPNPNGAFAEKNPLVHPVHPTKGE